MYTSPNACTFPIADVSGFKKKVLNWLQPFSTFCFLDNQHYHLAPHQAECLVAAGVKEQFRGSDITAVDSAFSKEQWLFGHLSYELKNTLHNQSSVKEDKIGFSPFGFFVPEIVLVLNDGALTIYATEPEAVFDTITAQQVPVYRHIPVAAAIRPVLSREAYLEKIAVLQAHILRGDCYEVNFCQEFFARQVQMNPAAVFQHLMQVSPNPYSAFYRNDNSYLICASPERFLSKKNQRVLSQPIKGTIQRDRLDADKDAQLKESLRLSQKEQAENVMVVDLVRNDLTRICKPTTVKVDELFGIYSFPQVHQMISTISGELREDVSFSEIIKALFPMGSMTGAPKKRVMELIDSLEPSARGIFSGSVGYKAPNGDFDFNVVIRSVMYNAASGYLSYQVGSGITFYADAGREWDECMLKAEALRKVLS